MAERRARGLCYNCDEPYSVGHQCKKLFWLELANQEVEEPTIESVVEPEFHFMPSQDKKGQLQCKLGLSFGTVPCVG